MLVTVTGFDENFPVSLATELPGIPISQRLLGLPPLTQYQETTNLGTS